MCSGEYLKFKTKIYVDFFSFMSTELRLCLLTPCVSFSIPLLYQDKTQNIYNCYWNCKSLIWCSFQASPGKARYYLTIFKNKYIEENFSPFCVKGKKWTSEDSKNCMHFLILEWFTRPDTFTYCIDVPV